MCYYKKKEIILVNDYVLLISVGYIALLILTVRKNRR